jgi:electron transfer flavoprotein beta subunit
MPKCLVCYKWALDEKDIKIKPDDLSLDVTRAKGKISDFDRNAFEEATLLVEQQGGSVDALTFGTSTVNQSLKDVLSRGPGCAYFIADNCAEKADAFVTANVLAAAIRKLGPFDLILCGEGSSDSFNQQIAVRLAALLGLPCVSYVLKLSVENGTVKATRGLGESTEVATVKGPVVLSVSGQINHPRIPSLKQVLGAAKKPKKEIKIADLGLTPVQLQPREVHRSVKGFVTHRKHITFKEAAAPANVAKLVSSLAAEGLQ